MPTPYPDSSSRRTAPSGDGAPTVKSHHPEAPTRATRDDSDLIIPAGLAIVRCPPGVARGAYPWSWDRGSGRGGRRMPAGTD